MKSLHAWLPLGLAVAMTAMPAFDADASAAKPAKSDTNACVFSNTINDWQQLDSTTLVVWGIAHHDAYLVKLSMPLPNIGPINLGFIDRDRNGMLCGYGMDQVFSPDPVFRQRSTVIGMTKLDTPALAGLEEQYKVKLLPKPKNKDKQDAAEKAPS